MAPSRPVSVVLSLVVTVILAAAGYIKGEVLFSQLPNALVVTATLPSGGPITEIRATHDPIVVTWSANTSSLTSGSAGVPFSATKVRTQLCFATESQIHRAWRATKDNLAKDRTCVHDIALASYTPGGASVQWTPPNSVPGANYCVRAYALDENGQEVAYGQSSPDRIAHTFTITSISGRNRSLNVAVAVMSIASIVLLFGSVIFDNCYLRRKKRM